MNRRAASVRNHCLSPERARVSIDAPIVAASYARMFPELPSFAADEQFLHALGRAGGLCDCGDIDTLPTPWAKPPLGGPSLANSWLTILQRTARTCGLMPIRQHCTTLGAHNSTSNAYTGMGRPATPSPTSATIQRSSFSARTTRTYSEMPKALR